MVGMIGDASPAGKRGAAPADEPGIGAAARLAPVQRAGRIKTLDFIRGIAVMGILGANIIAFGQPFEAYVYPRLFLTEHGMASDWLLIGQYVLIDNKMRGLFTLLFGAGLYLFMERAWARGATRSLQAWRLVVLLGFGLIHFFVLWRGDILTYYALIGLLALPFLKLRAMTQLSIGVTAYAVGIVFSALSLSFPYLIVDTAMGEQPAFADARAEMILAKAHALELAGVETRLIEAGDFADLITHRLTHHALDPLSNTLFFLLETLPLILIGAALYRMGFFSEAFDRKKMLRWGWAGVAAGAVISLALALQLKAGGFTYYTMLAGYIGWSPLPQLLMTLGYAALLVVFAHGRTGWLFERVTAAGRVAFSNYIGTTLLMLTVFQGWGLGWFGDLARPGLYLVMIVAWIVMLAWSKPWLERFRYGPLEWVWRCLTYRRTFALRQ